MNVVINRTDAIGDFLLTSPMAEFIKKKYPGAKVSFIVSPRNSTLVPNCPAIDQYLIIDPKESFIKKFLKVKKFFKDNDFNYYFFVGGDHTPTFLSFLLRLPFRGGLKSKWPSLLFLNKGIRQSRSTVEMHERDYNLQLLKSLDSNFDFQDYEQFVPKIELDKSAVLADIGYFKQELEITGFPVHLPWVFIHPGMTGHTLNWSSRNYARLIFRLSKQTNNKLMFFISYTPADEEHMLGFNDEITHEKYDDLKKHIYFFDGSIKGLTYYLSILSNADIFIGPSTGTTHLANALNIPLIGLYSPIKVQSALRWGPLAKDGHKQEIIFPDVICGEQFKCAGEICPYYECMGKIEVEQVCEKALGLLNLRE